MDLLLIVVDFRIKIRGGTIILKSQVRNIHNTNKVQPNSNLDPIEIVARIMRLQLVVTQATTLAKNLKLQGAI